MDDQLKIDADDHWLCIKSRLCSQGFRYRPNIDFGPDNIASYAPHAQRINIGLMFEV